MASLHVRAVAPRAPQCSGGRSCLRVAVLKGIKTPRVRQLHQIARSAASTDPWTGAFDASSASEVGSLATGRFPFQAPGAGTPLSASGTAAAPASRTAGGSGSGSGGSGGGDVPTLLAELRARALSAAYVNVYGKPLTKSELSALDVALQHMTRDAKAIAAAEGGRQALRAHLRGLLLEAAAHKRIPLPVVEGAMVLLEVLTQGAASGEDDEDDLVLVPRRRWQLVVGADVGAVQYIPAVEELQVATDGASFTLGTDLDFVFTGFRGPCQWLAPGHLSYDVRQVRIELRAPKGWRRAAAWLAWRWRLGDAAPAAAAAGDEPEWEASLPWSQTCHEDPSAPAVLVPLPFFPTNEILAYSCDGQVAATRSKLTGGLILLLEVRTRERLRGLERGSRSGRHAVLV